MQLYGTSRQRVEVRDTCLFSDLMGKWVWEAFSYVKLPAHSPPLHQHHIRAVLPLIQQLFIIVPQESGHKQMTGLKSETVFI